MTPAEEACKSCSIWVALMCVVSLWVAFLFVVIMGFIEQSSWIVSLFDKKPIVFFIVPVCALGAFSIVVFFKVIGGAVSISVSSIILSESASQIILWAILFLSLCGGTFIIWQLEYPSPY